MAIGFAGFLYVRKKSKKSVFAPYSAPYPAKKGPFAAFLPHTLERTSKGRSF
jgi:hypothetical protein